MSDLSGKTILITGAARRIGAVTAKTLHQAGASVVIHYHHSAAEALQLQNELNQIRPDSCFLVAGDLIDISKLASLVKQVLQYTGQLDALINNASSFFPTPLASLTEEQWDNLLTTNLKAPVFLAQAAAPYLKQTHGSIINMVDIHAMRPFSDHIAYGAAKAGLLMATQILARDLAPEIRVNGIAPGAILWPEQNSGSSSQAAVLEKIALKRAGSPEDIANAILFLISQAPYVTGHIFPIDGGRLLNY